MAKYTVLMSCGHEDTVILSGKSYDKERKIEYFKSSGLCKECYKKKMRQQEKAEGLVFNVSVLPYIDESNGELLLYVWFSGDTLPHKDEIKALGYKWSERESEKDYYSSSNAPKCWNQTIRLSDLKEEANNAASIGATCTATNESLLKSVNCQVALHKQNEWKEKHKNA